MATSNTPHHDTPHGGVDPSRYLWQLMEIDCPECEIGTPICVAFTVRGAAPTSGDEVDRRLRQLRKLADFVAQEVAT